MREIIQQSYLIIVANVTLLLFVHFNSTLAVKRKLCFLLAGIISLVMLGTNVVSYTFEGTGEHIWLITFCNAIGYTISGPVMIPFIVLSGVIKKPTRIAVISCATVNMIASFASIITGWIFTVDSTGTVKLGPLSPMPYMFSAMYLAILIVASIIKFRFGQRSESIFLLVLSGCIIAATFLNTVLHYHYLITGMAVLSTIFYYMYFTTQTLTRDALTNALNRHSFYKDIATLKKKQMIVISMDLNWLKQINDTQGHDAGDRAILSVAECAVELLPVRCRFYRVGGDEFEALCPNMSLDDAKALAEKLRAAVKAKGYSVAYGCAEYQKGMDFDAVFRDADAIMYADKAEIKKYGAPL